MGQMLSIIARWLWGSSDDPPLIPPSTPHTHQQPVQTTTHHDRHQLNSISYGLSTEIAVASSSSSSSKPSPDTRHQPVQTTTHHDRHQLNSISYGLSTKIAIASSSKPSPDTRQQPAQTTTRHDLHQLNSISHGLSTEIAIVSSSSSKPCPDTRQQPVNTSTHHDRHQLNSISYGLSTKIASSSSSSSKPSRDTRQQLVHPTHHDQRQLNSYGPSTKIVVASSLKPSQQQEQTTYHPLSSRPSGSTSPSLLSTSGGVTGASHFQTLPSPPTTNINGTLPPYSPLRTCSSDDHALLHLSVPSKLKTQAVGDGKRVSSALRLQQYHTINEKEERSEGVVPKNWCDYRICEEEDEEEEEEEDRVEQKIFSIQVRWIKHYSSEHKILLVGEGDFSFSAALAEAFVSATNLTATSLDSEEFLSTNYKNALPNINRLRRLGAMVMHGVDATKMAKDFPFGSMRFDRVVFNFPLAGFFPHESKEVEIWRHRLLVQQFFENAKRMIETNGEIHVTHKSNGFFKEWNLEFLGTRAVGLRLIEEVAFDFKEYPGYRTKYGFGGDKNFDSITSKTYKFGLRKQNERQPSYNRFMR